MSCKNNLVKLFMYDNDNGNEPVNKFSFNCNNNKWVRSLKLFVILPVNRLLETFNICNLCNFDNDNGKVPVMMLLPKLKYVKFL